MSSIEPHRIKATLNYYLEPEKGGYEAFWFGTVGEKRRPFEYVEVPITDMRGHEQEFKLDTHGFEYIKVSSKLSPEDTNSYERIEEVYYPECEELIKSMTGAYRVHVMGHVCRKQNWDTLEESLKTQDDMKRTPIPTSARYIHVDYSYHGSKTRLESYLPKEASELSKKRWAIINIWRPIYTVTRENLAVLDARSIHDSELRPVLAKFRRPDDSEKLSPNTRAAHSRNDVETWSVAPPKTAEQHKWYYCSNLDPSEALLIKMYDSSEKEGLARRVPHTAFTCDEDCGDQRQSIELRGLVFWDDES